MAEIAADNQLRVFQGFTNSADNYNRLTSNQASGDLSLQRVYYLSERHCSENR